MRCNVFGIANTNTHTYLFMVYAIRIPDAPFTNACDWMGCK